MAQESLCVHLPRTLLHNDHKSLLNRPLYVDLLFTAACYKP